MIFNGMLPSWITFNLTFCLALSRQLCKAGNDGSRCILSHEKATWLYLEGKAWKVGGIRIIV